MRERRSVRASLAAVTLLSGALAAAPRALAQSTTSSLHGTVSIRGGGTAPGAIVVGRSDATGAERSTVTDAEGRYRLDLLLPGSWKIEARLGDALRSAPLAVSLRLQQTLRLDLVVEAAVSESVTVTSDAPLVDPARTGGEMRIQEAQIDALPLNGRTFTDLALLDSSVRPTPPGNFYGERGSVLEVNGQSGRANSFLVDGLDNNDLTSGTGLNAFFSQQVIREFVVMTHQYAPEFGRAGGGILNIVTEQGANETTGDFFVQGVRRDFNDPGRFVDSLPSTLGQAGTPSRLETGFRLGGPLRRDKAFYFLAFEHQAANEVTPFTGVGRDLQAGGLVTAPNRDDNLFLRTDYNLSSTQFLMVRLSVDDRATSDLNVGGTTTPEAGFKLDERDVQLASSWTSILSKTLLNEARLLVGTSAFDQSANSSRPGVDRPSGTFGGNNLNRQQRDEDRFEVLDNVTWSHGAHSFKFGADVVRSRTGIHTRFNPNGNFQYDTDAPFEPGDCGDLTATDVKNYGRGPIPCPGQVGVDDDGDGVIDEPGFIGTYPFVYQLIEGQPSADLYDTRLGLFAQDTWQAGARWMLDYGLRYDVSTFQLPKSTAVPSFIPNGGAGRDTNNVAPRLGFTFAPTDTGRVVLRGGAGVFYDKLVLGFPAVAAITSGTRIGLLFPQGLTLELTEKLVEQIGIDTLKPALFFPEPLVMRFSTGTRLDTPYAVHYNLGAEWSVGARGAFEVNVTRALGYHQALFRDLNPVVTKDINGMPQHRDLSHGSITSIVTEGRSWYTGLDLGWRWRSRRAWYSASYTFAKALDLGPDPLKGGISLPPDSDHLSREKGRSDTDRRHRFVLAAESGLGWLGLRASGVLQYATAAPFNVTTGRDENLDGITTDRPPGVGRNTGAETSLAPINALRQDESILRQQLGLAPLAPIRTLRAPAYAQVDVRVWRPFPLRASRGTGQVFVQVFNLFDRFNGGPIEGRATAVGFGKPLGQIGPPRTLEAGLKVGF